MQIDFFITHFDLNFVALATRISLKQRRNKSKQWFYQKWNLKKILIILKRDLIEKILQQIAAII